MILLSSSLACMHTRSLQSCPALCGPMDYSLPGSSVRRILQARTLEWAATPSSGDLPDPGTEPASPALAGRSFTAEPQGKPHHKFTFVLKGAFYKPS